jgi:hypothetical protein
MLPYFLGIFVPSPGGAFWLGLLVAAVIFGDFERFASRRNLTLAALFAVAVLLVDVMRWNERPDSPLAAWAFTGIYVGTGLYALWGLALSRRETALPWTVNLPRSGLRALLGIVLTISAVTALGREPDDAGYYSNLGARRLVETGILPYGDPMLKGPDAPAYGASATYGPLLYLSHVPFQWIAAAEANPADANPMDPTYVRPPIVATQMATLAFFLAGLWALYTIVARLRDPDIALGVTALYACSPYILGLGGTTHVVGGLAFVSHIAPSSVMLLAFAALRRPAWAGALLAAAAGVLFYPVFVFPAWVGWFVWRRAGVRSFVAGFVITGLLIGAFVAAFTPVPEGSNVVSVFLESTLEHQEGVGPQEYGASQFGFWGTQPRLAAFWQQPIVGSSSLFKPTFLVYGLACLAAFFLARGRTMAQLAGITAALTAGVQLWKTHAAGSYVEWYLPFLLIALFAVGHRSRETTNA